VIRADAFNTWQEMPRSEHEEVSYSLDEITEPLLGALPSAKDLAQWARASLARDEHLELRPVERPNRRLWLVSDPDGPGYARQKVYGRIAIDHEAALAAAHKRAADRFVDKVRAEMERQVRTAVEEMTSLVRERVSTFRAYNELGVPMRVTVRHVGDQLIKYAARRDTGRGVRLTIDNWSDRILIHLVGYFVVCPPGEEHKPDQSGT
jgi:hypothetical protein